MVEDQESHERMVEGMLGEWKRSMLTFWVLSLLLMGDSYGLAIAKEVERSTQGKIRLGPSTVYQLLRRLEKRELVESRWERTTQGPPRAYYKITPSGRETIRRFVDEVFSPTSPIAAALNELMPKVMQRLYGGGPPSESPPDMEE